MAIESNQFGFIAEKGQMTLLENLNLVNCKIDDSETETLVPGYPVKIKDISNKVIVIEAADALTDDVFGFVPYNVKKNEYVAGEFIKVALDNCAMYMEASAAIAQGANIQADPATQKVATAVAPNLATGKALTKASADGDLIVVLIKTPVIVKPV